MTPKCYYCERYMNLPKSRQFCEDCGRPCCKWHLTDGKCVICYEGEEKPQKEISDILEPLWFREIEDEEFKKGWHLNLTCLKKKELGKPSMSSNDIGPFV